MNSAGMISAGYEYRMMEINDILHIKYQLFRPESRIRHLSKTEFSTSFRPENLSTFKYSNFLPSMWRCTKNLQWLVPIMRGDFSTKFGNRRISVYVRFDMLFTVAMSVTNTWNKVRRVLLMVFVSILLNAEFGKTHPSLFLFAWRALKTTEWWTWPKSYFPVIYWDLHKL